MAKQMMWAGFPIPCSDCRQPFQPSRVPRQGGRKIPALCPRCVATEKAAKKIKKRLKETEK